MVEINPIVIIDDDTDDQEILDELSLELLPGSPLRNFNNGVDALRYLESTTEQPFIIICDVNMPRMNGLELLETIFTTPFLRKKAIPFVMLSTSGDKKYVERAYENCVNGFFQKPPDLKQLRNLLAVTFDYWRHSLHPHHPRMLKDNYPRS